MSKKNKTKLAPNSMTISEKILYDPENAIDDKLCKKLMAGLAAAGDFKNEINVDVTAEEFERLLEICNSVS
jgi:hypothetical protein